MGQKRDKKTSESIHSKKKSGNTPATRKIRS